MTIENTRVKLLVVAGLSSIIGYNPVFVCCHLLHSPDIQVNRLISTDTKLRGQMDIELYRTPRHMDKKIIYVLRTPISR